MEQFCGGGLGFVGGLIVGGVGALYITYNGEACNNLLIIGSYERIK